jgi:hypothetical protein
MWVMSVGRQLNRQVSAEVGFESCRKRALRVCVNGLCNLCIAAIAAVAAGLIGCVSHQRRTV